MLFRKVCRIDGNSCTLFSFLLRPSTLAVHNITVLQSILSSFFKTVWLPVIQRALVLSHHVSVGWVLCSLNSQVHPEVCYGCFSLLLCFACLSHFTHVVQSYPELVSSACIFSLNLYFAFGPIFLCFFSSERLVTLTLHVYSLVCYM